MAVLVAPMCRPLERAPFSSKGQGLELARLLGERLFDRQALHAAGAVETMAGRAASKHLGGVGRHGDRTAVTQDGDVGADLQRALRNGVDLRGALLQGLRRGGADG